MSIKDKDERAEYIKGLIREEYLEIIIRDLKKRMPLVPQEWLQRKISVREAEAKYMVLDKRLGDKGVPFGFINRRWKALLAMMIKRDELWEFRSEEWTWPHLCGREGIALVRNGKVIGYFYTGVS